MLNILFLDWQYISFTYDYRRYILPFLFSLREFIVEVGDDQIWVKPRSSDMFTIYEIYRDKGYSPKLEYGPGSVKTVVDFGANIGIFSLWASRFFHRAKKIYAVEMEDASYKQLLANIAINELQGIILPIQAAIFSESGAVGIRRMDVIGSFHMLDLHEKSKIVKALSLKDFLALAEIDTIDLLKIDIEGAEKYLLTLENEEIFRNKVRYVFLETHSVNDFRTEHGVEYFQKLGFEITLTTTPYVLDHNRIIDARNLLLCHGDQHASEAPEQLEVGHNQVADNTKERTFAGSPGD